MASASNQNWDIRRKGRAWKRDEAMSRFLMKPGKIELVDRKLLVSASERETLLCLLLENVGADRVVQFGEPEVWRAAVARLGAH